ncbi:hypothetical protein CO695_01425 [Providencia alcalifaciens]|nr:hypothetical protein CO695_01425 [Providencia alcalifaciens]
MSKVVHVGTINEKMKEKRVQAHSVRFQKIFAQYCLFFILNGAYFLRQRQCSTRLVALFF